MRMKFVIFGLLALTATSVIGLPTSARAQADAKNRVQATKDAPEPNVKDDKVARDGFNLHFRIVGREGPLLVILSGGPGLDVSYMSGVADELSKKYRCVMLEQRGTGRSLPAKYDDTTVTFPAYFGDLEALRSHLGQEKLILVGHSWGTMLALAYAGAHPDRVGGIVTLGSGPIRTAGFSAFEHNIKVRMTDDDLAALAALRLGQPDPSGRGRTPADINCAYYTFDRKLGRKFIADHPVRVLKEFKDRTPPMMKTVDQFVADKLPAITAPTLIVHGRQDVAPESVALEVHRTVKGSKLQMIDRCGHFTWIERPAETWEAVYNFLSTLQ